MRKAGHNGVRLGSCVLGAASLLLGCSADAGTEPPSDFCKAVDSLTASVTEISENPLTRNSIGAVETSLATIMSGVENLEASAQPEFSDEVEAVDMAASSLDKTVTAAVDQPTPSNIDAARTSLSEVTSAVKDLSKSTSSSC
jgi:hypothetical protein